MVTKSRTGSSGTKKGKVKVGKLKLKKETVKNLEDKDLKNVKGGMRSTTRVQQQGISDFKCTQLC
jgi:natural product precursor